MGFNGISAPVFSPLVAGSHFAECFCFVAVVAECLQVVEVVCSSAGYVLDVVNFKILATAAFNALVVVTF